MLPLLWTLEPIMSYQSLLLQKRCGSGPWNLILAVTGFQSVDVLCSHLAQQHAQATAELARVSHSRPHLQVGVASAGADATGEGQALPQVLRKAASTAVQGLRGTFFRHGSFLELVCRCGVGGDSCNILICGRLF
jgi:hypothetical protein